METKFSKIYEKRTWGNGSGAGSSPEYNKAYMDFLEEFMISKQIKTVLDIGCGDWQFSKYINWSDQYYFGVDCVKDVIQHNMKYAKDNIHFFHLDPTKNVDKLPDKMDLVILKDILQHWDNDTIVKFMDKLTYQGHKNILIINNYKDAEGKYRNIHNRYNYAKIDANQYPLNKYKPDILGYYKFKQVVLIHKDKLDS